MSKIVLVTGGAGYIGSHTCIELISAGFIPIVLDNFSNSHLEVIDRIDAISGSKILFYNGDARDKSILFEIFNNHDIEYVIHFAGLKSVSESCLNPIEYYDNNVYSILVLCHTMAVFGVKKIIFSSSATVYGDSKLVPFKENTPLGSIMNPYGRSKLIGEQVLQDIYSSDEDWSIVVLRYFNPVGAHPSGLIGDSPRGIPNNLMPYICQVASGQRECLNVFGDLYPTPDGTGIRDYIHVSDLALGHLAALNYVKNNDDGCLLPINLGAGRGYSVLEMINTFIQTTGKPVPYKIVDPRPGDVGICYADVTRAHDLLGWSAKLGIIDMCRDSWNWQCKNANGFVIK